LSATFAAPFEDAMSWSLFIFRGLAAHAHDNEQNTFMALAAMFVEVHPVHRESVWLREWQAFWIDAVGNQGNGVSELCPEAHLTDDGRIAEFREFLGDYRSWVRATAQSAQWISGFQADKLVEFTRTMEAVLSGDRTHPRIVRPYVTESGAEETQGTGGTG
jgi:hypothetical protein